jgi:hypothetical protein
MCPEVALKRNTEVQSAVRHMHRGIVCSYINHVTLRAYKMYLFIQGKNSTITSVA